MEARVAARVQHKDHDFQLAWRSTANGPTHPHLNRFGFPTRPAVQRRSTLPL